MEALPFKLIIERGGKLALQYGLGNLFPPPAALLIDVEAAHLIALWIAAFVKTLLHGAGRSNRDGVFP